MDIIRIAMIDLNGVFALDLLGRIVAIKRVKGILDMFSSNFEETDRGRTSRGVFDVFSGFKNKMRDGKDKKMIEDGEIELGEIYGGGGGDSFVGLTRCRIRRKNREENTTSTATTPPLASRRDSPKRTSLGCVQNPHPLRSPL